MFLIIAVLASTIQNGNAMIACNPRNDSLTNTFLELFFNTSLTEIKNMAGSLVQKPVSPNEVTFLRYSPGSNTSNSIDTRTTKLNCSLKTILIIHGWTDNGALPWIVKYAATFQQLDPSTNVIAVDWRRVANQSYFNSAEATKSVGEIAAQKYLSITGGDAKCFNNTQIIGHSLGAHIAGDFGIYVRDKTGTPIDRVTGLDPAGPLFTVPFCAPLNWRYNANDGKFTDCYHTNIMLEGQTPTGGQVDFYINCGGPIQPGCNDINLIDASSCSHQSIHEYYYNTISAPNIYPAKRCDNSASGNVYAGHNVNRTASGVFCVSALATKDSTNQTNIDVVEVIENYVPAISESTTFISGGTCVFLDLFLTADDVVSDII